MREPKLTNAQRRALEAVRDGKVTRVYRADGNTFQTPPGVGPQALWALDRRRLICDGDKITRGIFITVRMDLTDAGRKALWHEETTS
jgi:hypothetical protein